MIGLGRTLTKGILKYIAKKKGLWVGKANKWCLILNYQGWWNIRIVSFCKSFFGTLRQSSIYYGYIWQNAVFVTGNAQLLLAAILPPSPPFAKLVTILITKLFRSKQIRSVVGFNAEPILAARLSDMEICIHTIRSRLNVFLRSQQTKGEVTLGQKLIRANNRLDNIILTFGRAQMEKASVK